jgi:hypothetical protein
LRARWRSVKIGVHLKPASQECRSWGCNT